MLSIDMSSKTMEIWTFKFIWRVLLRRGGSEGKSGIFTDISAITYLNHKALFASRYCGYGNWSEASHVQFIVDTAEIWTTNWGLKLMLGMGAQNSWIFARNSKTCQIFNSFFPCRLCYPDQFETLHIDIGSKTTGIWISKCIWRVLLRRGAQKENPAYLDISAIKHLIYQVLFTSCWYYGCDN